MILIYPSKLEGEPLERHLIPHCGTTVNQWLVDNVRGYEWRESPPISIHLNGGLIDPLAWAETQITSADTVEIFPEPKLGGTFLGISYGAWLLAAVVVVAAVVLQPGIPKTGRGQGGRGDNLNESSLKGNKVKLNAPIREAFGTRKIYPDYLIPNHRYFENKRDQVVETHLSIGIGDFDVPLSSVLIGDTPMLALGDDASFTILDPGADVSGDSRCQWWHSAPEIGATSKGAAGLELTVTTDATPSPGASQYIFSGDTVTIPGGAGEFPDDWESGMLVRIVARYPYTITDGVGMGVRDVITGDITQLGLSVADTIEIAGDNAGDYIVDTVSGGGGTLTLDYSNGDPAASLVTGSVRMAIGFRGLLYRLIGVTTSTITLERLLSDGSTDAGWPGFSDITLDDAIITLDESTAEGGWLGPFAACPENQTTDRLEVDWFFPGGLVNVGSEDGGLYRRECTVELQYRAADSVGAWTSEIFVYEEKILDQIGFTELIMLPSEMRPECRARRIGARSTYTNVQDAVQWYALRSKLTGKDSYPGVTTMAVRVKGGSRLAAQAEQLVSVQATRKLPTRVDGEWTAPVATRDIAPAVAYIGKSLGYQDSDLDLAEFDRLDAVWKARGDTFDQSFESTTTAKEAINTALRGGFAELTIDRGRLRPVRDELRTVFEHLYTPQNCTEVLTRDFQAVTFDDFDGVDVKYTDSQTWQVETVSCRLDGDLGTRVQEIQLEGVTSRTQAWRVGMRARRAQKYRRYSYSTATELDALNSRYLSYVALAGDVPGYGKSALLLGFATLGSGDILLQSSEPFEWVPLASHIVAIRRPDGSLSGPYAATRVDDYRMTIPSIDFVPDVSWQIEPPHLLFGTVETWSFPALITDISPRGDSGVSLTAINYDARVYADDDNSPPS